MDGFIQKIAESKFMQKLEEFSMKISSSPAFSAISNGMGGTMNLIMTGAFFQVICVIASTFFGVDTSSRLYTILYTPYQWTMGILAFFMSYSIASALAKTYKVNEKMAGFTAMACYFIVCCPLTTIDGNTYINYSNLGSSNLFTAIIIGLTVAKIMQIAKEKNWTIKLPDSVPEGIGASFAAIIPTAICVIIWYALALIIETVTGGSTTLSTLIMYVLSIPMNFLISDIGMLVIIFLGTLFWFFGIHGTGVIFIAIMVPMFTAYSTNAALAAAGQPLQYSPVFLFSALSIIGGSGNTLPLVVLGLRSKSKTIQAVSKAALVPNICNINEPVIFGFPIMYNVTLAIPFFLNPMIVAVLLLIGYKIGFLAYPQVLIMTTLPVLFSTFMQTMDWKNVVFAAAMFFVVMLIWLPFFKVYEKKMLEQEALEEQEENK